MDAVAAVSCKMVTAAVIICCSCLIPSSRAGGYLQYIFRTAARELFGMELPWTQPLQLRTLRNADFQEVSLERGGRTLLRFALAYGFRNIQTIVRPCSMCLLCRAHGL